MSDDDTPKYQDPEWLYQKYHEEGLTQREIAQLCECTDTTIGKYMRRHGIEVRDWTRHGEDTRYRNRDWLYKKYHEEGLSQPDIAEKCGCSAVTISNWMDKHGIPTDTDRGGSR